MPPTAIRVSGHKSKVQKTIGTLFNFPINIAGIPTVIGDGS